MAANGTAITDWRSASMRWARGVPRSAVTRFDPVMLASGVLLNILGLALPLVTLHVYDRVIPNAAFETLTLMAIGLVVVAAVDCALRCLQSLVLAPSAAKYAQELKLEALDRYLAADGKARGEFHTPTALIERLGAIDRYAGFYGGSARQAMIDAPFAVLALVIIALIGGPLVFAPLLALVAYFAALFVLGVALLHRTRERAGDDLKITDFLLETLSSIMTVKSLRLEGVMQRRYERLLLATLRNHDAMMSLNALTQRLSAIFGNLAVVATLTVGAILAMNGHMTIGAVAASTLLAGRMVQPGIRAARAWTEAQRARVAADEVEMLFAKLPARPAVPDVAPEAAKLDAPRAPAIAFNGATSFSAPSGAAVAIVGGEAQRRRELLEALCGLRQCANVRVDGVDATAYRAAHPEEVVFAPRAPTPIRGAILDNLTLFGRLNTPEDALRWAEAVGLDEDVRKLPVGFDTVIGGSTSDNLSLSAAYKIALARALAQRPRLLALEHPTAYLDSAEAARVFAALRQTSGERTLVASLPREELDPLFDVVWDLDAIPEGAPECPDPHAEEAS